MTETETIIELEGFTKRYGYRTALDNVSLKIPAGVSGLLGPNGCGKSTMIKSLLGLLKVQSGRAKILGYELPREIGAIRDAVGYLPEDDCYFAGLSGIESVSYMAKLSGLPGSEALRRAHEAMDFADFGQERYRNAETYSTGMRQKLKFAQAIVHDPQLLIMDEPTSGLDPEQRTSMLRKISNLAQRHGKSVLICTHILHDVRTVCENVVIMSNGQIRLADSLENLSKPSSGGVFVEVEPQQRSTDNDPYPDARILSE
ncbi:MAG: ABC transporter ATP-binding protein, partial [Planctomycetota bacterium]